MTTNKKDVGKSFMVSLRSRPDGATSQSGRTPQFLLTGSVLLLNPASGAEEAQLRSICSCPSWLRICPFGSASLKTVFQLRHWWSCRFGLSSKVVSFKGSEVQRYEKLR
jgi:hypothetical protein